MSHPATITSETPVIRTAARIWVAADSFYFLAFAFGLFYLRTLNENGRWHPAGESASTGLLIATAVVLVVGAVGIAVMARGGAAWLGWVGVASQLVGAVLCFWQLLHLNFATATAGAFGSLLVGFLASMVVHLLGAAYWSEVGTMSQARTAEAGTVAGAATNAVFLAAMFVLFAFLFLVL
ncbi:MAG TPA: hypothetical protein VHL51_15445 [Gaiellales bacterium]|jgi:hypothetical protein|nr:hypothetical protein [Gaiellales bacterium]